MESKSDVDGPALEVGPGSYHRLLFETMEQGALCLDASGRVVSANPAAERLLGLGTGEMTGRAMSELRVPMRSEEGKEYGPGECPFGVAMRTGQRIRGAHVGVVADVAGGVRWLRMDVTPGCGGEGQSLVCVTFLDVTDQRRAEERLRDQEAKFRTLAENSLDLVSRHDLEGRFMYASMASRSLLGYEPEELLRMSPYDLSHPDDLEEVRRAHRTILERGAVCTLDHRFRRKDGAYQWLETSSKVVVNDRTGEQLEIHAVSRDISRRKRTEEALKASEDRMRTLVANLPVVLFALDQHGVFTLSEGQGLATLGLKPGQVVGLSLFEVYPDALEIHGCVKRALAGEVSTSVTPLGEAVFVVWYSPMRRPDGQVEGVIGVATDITAQKRAEEQLRLLSEAVEQSPASVVITNPQGVIEYVNERFEEVTGYSREEALGRRPNVLKSGQMDPGFYRELWRTLTSGGVWRGEFHNRRKDGRLFWESAVITPVKDEQGRVAHFVATKEDVTERKQAEEMRVRLEAQLRESQKLEAFGQLAGGIAHDFNNILTVIQSHACMMQEGLLKEGERVESVREIARSAERAANLTSQLLAFSRRQVLQPRDLDLNDVLRGMMRMLQRLIGEHIVLEATFAEGVAPVHADAGMLEQVILNLAVNARDAMPRGGRLTLFTETMSMSEAELVSRPQAHAGSFVCLGVSDTGAGIPSQLLTRIFEPFFTTKEIGKGTGLGLSTVMGIVQQHSGWVEVRSEEGKGSTFLVFLPKLGRSLKVEERPPVAREVERGTETVLVVEDESPLRMLVRTILERQGYQVLEAANGPEAVAAWEKHRPHVQLLLTDMVMPEGITGVELAQQLQSEMPSLKVIYSSGYSEEALETRFLRRGTKFLAKPYDPVKLTRMVRDCLDGK